MPFLTVAPSKMFAQLGLTDEAHKSWESLSTIGCIPAGTKVEKGNPIFPRLEMEVEVEYIKEQMKSSAPKVEEKKKKNRRQKKLQLMISLKVELRVAEVLSAEPVKKADKLLKIQLDLGTEKRQVVSGIAKFYSPEDLKGKRLFV